MRSAIDLVSDGGEDALTLRALGDAAGLSRGAPYRHFEDKDALVRAIAAEGMVELTAKMKAGEKRDGFRGAMRAYVAWAMKNPAWYNLTFRDRAVSPAAGAKDDPEVAAASHEMGLFVLRLVSDGQRAGELPNGPPEELMLLLWSTLHGAVDLALAGHAKTAVPSDHPNHVVDALIKFLKRR